MKTIYGHGACAAIAIGRIIKMKRQAAPIRKREITDIEGELTRFSDARQKVDTQLAALCEEAKKTAGENEAQIFEIHRMMLYDDDFDESVTAVIKEQFMCAEYAVMETAENLSRIFSGMSSEYMRARAADVKDIARRLTDELEGKSSTLSLDHPAIIAADDLTPGETMKLDKRYVLGFVTENGSENSHTAILARTLNIPAVVGTGPLPDDIDGVTAVLDGMSGVMYLDPDEETYSSYARRRRTEEERRRSLDALRGKKSITADGRRIRVYANIGDISDIRYAISGDAEGIGLFRSEFLYMKYGRAPTEEEQFTAYKKAVEEMGSAEVIIRTLDAGADKKLDFLGIGDEPNPALGLRAIRICLEKENLFKTQLRAIYRASAYGNISIMLPMIVSAEEIIRAKKIASQVTDSLQREGIPYRSDTKIGVMIETPAAAICADELAAVSDFFSIGTNDLLQYTMAADRQNSKVSHLTAGAPKAVMRLIKNTAKVASDAGIWAGICGEMAADTELIPLFLKWGITELSVAPPKILTVRKAVIESRVHDNNSQQSTKNYINTKGI